MKFVRNILKSSLTRSGLGHRQPLCRFCQPPLARLGIRQSQRGQGYTDPTSFVTPSATSSVEVAITILLGLFAGANSRPETYPKDLYPQCGGGPVGGRRRGHVQTGVLTQEKPNT
ncbi:MAG: hypothetical protein IPM81_22780 [Saprospirales bacterium]|nr:hypothetical protein [Saprospirales bacterium]